MDFYEIVTSTNRRTKKVTVKPSFSTIQVKDLVCQGGEFAAYWDGKEWIDDLGILMAQVDKEVWEAKEKADADPNKPSDFEVVALTFNNYDSNVLSTFKKYCKDITQSTIEFNTEIKFANEEIKREDYSTRQLSYAPTDGEHPAFDEIINTLYAPEERDRILWCMGLILAKRTQEVQKFMFMYGGKGTGKGTIIKIFRMLFGGYDTDISLAELTSASSFATAQVKDAPLMIDDDSDISRITNDTNLLKLTGHDPILVNGKYSVPYTVAFNGLLITGSNQPYKVRDQNAGITRRALVVRPSGTRIPPTRYKHLMAQVEFEIPAVAHYALKRFEELGISAFEEDNDTRISEETDLMFAFVKEYEDKLGDTVTLKKATEFYKMFLEEYGYDLKGAKRKIKSAFSNVYYEKFYDDKQIDGVRVYSVFEGLKREILHPKRVVNNEKSSSRLALTSIVSKFDEVASTYPAQLTTADGLPQKAWDDVTTILSDIDTHELHFVRVPENHIVIDFDLKNIEGEKDLALNLEAASEFPKTYAEVSKSGKGVHLHYMYDGNVSKLAPLIRDNIEVKVFSGKSSLRRKLTQCNELDIATISTGLPLKEEKDLFKDVGDIIWNEAKMRKTIEGNIRKEYHSATKPSVDFIAHVLEQAQAEGIKYDLRDMRQSVLLFAMNSTNHKKYCMDVVKNMVFNTMEDENDQAPVSMDNGVVADEDLVMYDIEVFQNLFVVSFGKLNEENTTWINPSPEQIESLLSSPLVGFNNRGYDNHIMYSAMMGASNLELYKQSQRIIGGGRFDGLINTAYELSYADIYEYSSKKQSLKKWEIELGIHHDELEIPWDKPVPEELWERVGEYCSNDVDATKEVFLETKADYNARKILASLSGLSINSKTQQHAAAFLFGNERRPQDKFVYTDLSKDFPGYTFKFEKREIKKKDGTVAYKNEMTSTYQGEIASEGGYVFSKPGIYENVKVFDVASMHPASLIAMNYFGPYTQKYADLRQARIYVKHRQFDKAGEMFNGALKPYLNEDDADDLAYALKIIINIVYGMTSASYDNKFRHPDNKDNIVAKRGALFMIQLQHAVQDLGYEVIHIKTDSIKVSNADDFITDFILNYGNDYGYEFEHEETFDKIALVNKSVLIGHIAWHEKEHKIGKWEAVGAMYADPFIYKTLFTHEEVQEQDFSITKQTTSPMYLDGEFIGKVAQVYASNTGGTLTRGEKHDAVTGTKGYKFKLWSDYKDKKDLDMTYYHDQLKKAINAIDEVGSVREFLPDLDDILKRESVPF